MTKKDLELIERAKNIPYTRWYDIEDLENEADTEEAREQLRSIATSKYHTEEYYAGCL